MAEEFVPIPARFEREADKRVFLALRRELWAYEPLRATRPRLEIDVTQGSVRLTGRVRTLAMKEIAGYICQRIDGVRQVQNELVSDTEVVRQVAAVLATDPELAPLCLRTDARGGVATLGGDIPRVELEDRAIALARSAPGVIEVVSELAVRSSGRPPTAPSAKRAATSTGTESAAAAGGTAGL